MRHLDLPVRSGSRRYPVYEAQINSDRSRTGNDDPRLSGVFGVVRRRPHWLLGEVSVGAAGAHGKYGRIRGTTAWRVAAPLGGLRYGSVFLKKTRRNPASVRRSTSVYPRR